MSIALGLMLVGGLIPQMVNVNFAFQYTQGDLVVSIQEILNNLIPGVVPLLLTLGVYRLIKKGKNPVLIILGTIVISILLVWIGVLK